MRGRGVHQIINFLCPGVGKAIQQPIYITSFSSSVWTPLRSKRVEYRPRLVCRQLKAETRVKTFFEAVDRRRAGVAGSCVAEGQLEKLALSPGKVESPLEL
jgi:hypothetical protein